MPPTVMETLEDRRRHHQVRSCASADELALACGYGSSADLTIAGSATEVCEKGFGRKLTAADRKVYAGLDAKCDAKYAGVGGTVYVSMNAFYKLSVATLFSDLYTPAE